MKSTLAVFVVSAFATCVFAIERITAAESAAAAIGACAGCCEKSCSGAQSSCPQAQTTASTACPNCEVKATVVSTIAPATSACCSENGACCCEEACCKQHAATSTPATTIAAPSTKAIVAKINAAAGSGECENCCSCKSQCATACTADLQRTGLDPYRIEPPDVLSIYVPMLEPACAEVREKLAAKGISLDLELPCSNAECEQAVRPDGKVAINGIGDVCLAGKTVEEARLAIMKKIFEACPQASQAAFAVVVNVTCSNSKQAYVVLQGGAQGDNVCAVPVTTGMTVNCAICKSTWPHPVDFAKTKILIKRPGQGGETVLPVTWDLSEGEPTDETNHAILPGDRLFVQLASEPAPPAPPTPVDAAVLRGVLQAAPCCPQNSTATLTLTPPTSSPVTPYVPGGPAATYYSAFLEAVPSPFAPQAGSPYLSTPLVDTQAFICTVPPQAPPVAVAQAPQCTAGAGDCSAATCASCAASQTDSSAKIAQVLFAVEVIEDHTGSLQEFKALQSDMPILAAESDVILPTIRILEKRDLVRTISSPKLVTVVDRPAQIQIGSEVPSEGSEKPSFQGLMLKTAAREVGGGLNVDFQFKRTRGNDALEVETSLIVAHGQTIVMKTTGRHRGPGENSEQNAGAEPAVYVVLTPELIK